MTIASKLRLGAALLLNLRRIPLRPVSHRLSLDLATRQLRDLVNEYNTSDEALVLCDSGD